MWGEVVLFLFGILVISTIVEVLPDYMRERARRITPLAAFPDPWKYLRPFEDLEPGENFRVGRDNWPALADAWALEAILRGFTVEWRHEGIQPDGWQIRVPLDYQPGRFTRPSFKH